MSKLYDLVFEGGGAKGSVFIGAMEEFYSRGFRPRRMIGTSAGAITAALLAAGYTPDELGRIAQEQQNGKPIFSSFMDMPTREYFSASLVDHSDMNEMF